METHKRHHVFALGSILILTGFYIWNPNEVALGILVGAFSVWGAWGLARACAEDWFEFESIPPARAKPFLRWDTLPGSQNRVLYFMTTHDGSGVQAGELQLLTEKQIKERPELTLGLVECDGRALSREAYRQLFKAIDIMYGSGDGQKTFNVPNMNRGYINGKP